MAGSYKGHEWPALFESTRSALLRPTGRSDWCGAIAAWFLSLDAVQIWPAGSTHGVPLPYQSTGSNSAGLHRALQGTSLASNTVQQEFKRRGLTPGLA